MRDRASPRVLDRAGGVPWPALGLSLLGIVIVVLEAAETLLRRRVVRELAALVALAAVVLVAFRDAITLGSIAFQNDTQVFYYPLELWFGEEFKAGGFPLWNPFIFGGYAIFADGELGLSYPLHIALLSLLPVPSAFMWLRISSVLVAAFSTYALCRSLGLGRLAALLGGVTFSLGSFFTTQQHHENVTRTAAWIPLILAGTEWGLRSRGWQRHGFLTIAAIALGMAGLGLHPQVLAMALLAFLSFTLYRAIVMGAEASHHDNAHSQSLALPHGARRARLLLARLLTTTWVAAYVGTLGLALAAAQIFPIVEIGLATFRGSQPDYVFATSYALPLQNLVNLVLPYFFRGPDSQYWSLWAKWETTLFVGVVPLILGILGAVVGRGRAWVWYFLILALAALWVAFATYAPVDLYQYLWSLPGFSSFRVPGRYTLLFVLAWSVLAATGMQGLLETARRLRSPDGARRTGWAPGLVIGGLTVCAALGVWLMLHLRASLVADPEGSIRWIRETYLTLRNHGQGIDPTAVYNGLVFSLSTQNTRTAMALVVVAATMGVCLWIVLVGRAARFGQLALTGVTVGDLLFFGSAFHPTMPIHQIVQSTPAIQFLTWCTENAAQCGSGEEAPVPVPSSGAPAVSPSTSAARTEWRVYTPGTIPSLEFDRLVPFRVEDIGGYSSLQPKRHFTYWTIMSSVENRLMDIANVRYVVYPAQPVALPSYNQVPFDPEHPLMLGSRGSLGGQESYRLDGIRGNRILIIGALTRAVEIPDGDVVAEITVVSTGGSATVLPLVAGSHIAEWAYDRPDLIGRVKHRRPDTIAFKRPTVSPIDGQRHDYNVYYSEHDLPSATNVESVQIRATHPLGGIEIYGIGLYDFEAQQTTGVTRDMRSKFRRVYADGEVRIVENREAFPRAYVVATGRYAREDALAEMLDGPFDPRREVILEVDRPLDLRALLDRGATNQGTPPAEEPPPLHPSPANSERIPGGAHLIESASDRLVYRAAAPEGGYLVHVATFEPGWKAWVDGQETPILRANSLFRAIALPPGDHLVELRYEPEPVALGRIVSGAAAGLSLASIVLALAMRRRRPPTALATD